MANHDRCVYVLSLYIIIYRRPPKDVQYYNVITALVFVTSIVLFLLPPPPPPPPRLDRRYGHSFLSLSLPLAAGLLAIVLATEYFVPWSSEVPVRKLSHLYIAPCAIVEVLLYTYIPAVAGVHK